MKRASHNEIVASERGIERRAAWRAEIEWARRVLDGPARCLVAEMYARVTTLENAIKAERKPRGRVKA